MRLFVSLSLIYAKYLQLENLFVFFFSIFVIAVLVLAVFSQVRGKNCRFRSCWRGQAQNNVNPIFSGSSHVNLSAVSENRDYHKVPMLLVNSVHKLLSCSAFIWSLMEPNPPFTVLISCHEILGRYPHPKISRRSPTATTGRAQDHYCYVCTVADVDFTKMMSHSCMVS